MLSATGDAMKRRSRAGGETMKGQRQEAQAPKRRKASKAVAPSGSSRTREETEATRLARELNEALEQQTATSEVLRVISSSPSNLEPILQTILANATRICEANFGIINLPEGDALPVAAMHNAPEAFAEAPRTGVSRWSETSACTRRGNEASAALFRHQSRGGIRRRRGGA
jgi:hypothetical protein